jgi:hypothetical protein
LLKSQVSRNRGSTTRAHPSTAAVRAFAASLGIEKPTISQRALLARRLSFEEGLEPATSVPAVDLPPEARPVVGTVYDGFLLLVACRWAHTYGAPVVFTRKFAAAWCAVTEDEARAAIHDLHRLYRVIERVPEKSGRAWQWLPVLRTEARA